MPVAVAAAAHVERHRKGEKRPPVIVQLLPHQRFKCKASVTSASLISRFGLLSPHRMNDVPVEVAPSELFVNTPRRDLGWQPRGEVISSP